MYEQLLVANVGLSVGGNMATIAGLQGALGFIHAATELGYPANSLMFIRTPSDPTIGTLHYGYHEDGAGKYTTLPNILIGRDIKDTVVRGSEATHQAAMLHTGGWVQMGPLAHGGW